MSGQRESYCPGEVASGHACSCSYAPGFRRARHRARSSRAAGSLAGRACRGAGVTVGCRGGGRARGGSGSSRDGLTHPGYVNRIERFCAAGGGALDPDTRAVPASWEASLRAAGAGLLAVRRLGGRPRRCGFPCGSAPGPPRPPVDRHGFLPVQQCRGDSGHARRSWCTGGDHRLGCASRQRDGGDVPVPGGHPLRLVAPVSVLSGYGRPGRHDHRLCGGDNPGYTPSCGDGRGSLPGCFPRPGHSGGGRLQSGLVARQRGLRTPTTAIRWQNSAC